MKALALARSIGSDDDPHDVVRIHCDCGQPLYIGLHAGPTYATHNDQRLRARRCRIILLPDAKSGSVAIQRLMPEDRPQDWLKRHRAGWLKRRNG